ncbi:NrdH-redoxin [Colwellia sp. PAMC 20917]|jgi:glutaredoxin|uniref:glutaredoxin family protein n=1 Tax=unclassified Colwellia TaxID=196834 RepID=UPI000878A52D|nr:MULTISPECIES: glutaredoxin family protein [unclassified Colwellia]AOW76670.1 NrdH-redoxin [Colwellia sp. PAMC 20917]MBA6253973.1 glutaredoxin family protein [Colwellia sp. MB3u-55]MBA6335869.1 glutaredoxin family protein [Colwellia sp. BRX8-7]MBA6347488.1 glutaredoxin family protein [Colwellia sp. BRX8-9]MBA6350758.1 glutaredoxin family protein [Colwellia sp. BRX9-1]|tara:strand:- start:1601 stop:1828 length:228 start_codon:yes stop_codon:yes gene_type:complete
MKKIVLYSMSNCPHCDTAKAYLDKNNIAYRLCNVKTAAGQKEFRRANFRSVPVIKIGEEYLQGFKVAAFKALYED